MCPPMRAYWRHLANTIELVHPWAHSSPQPKWQIDQFSHFCIAHGRKSRYIKIGAPVPQNCPFPWVDLDPIKHMIPWTNLSPQPKWHLDWFSRFCTDSRRVSLYFSGSPLPPLELSLPMGDLDPHLIHGSLGPPKSSTQMASRSLQTYIAIYHFCSAPSLV